MPYVMMLKHRREPGERGRGKEVAMPDSGPLVPLLLHPDFATFSLITSKLGLSRGFTPTVKHHVRLVKMVPRLIGSDRMVRGYANLPVLLDTFNDYYTLFSNKRD